MPLASEAGNCTLSAMGTPPATPVQDSNTRVLGVDPGLQVTGYGVIEAGPRGPLVCEAGIIRSSQGRRAADMAQRVLVLYNGIVDVVEQLRPGVVAVEQLYAHYQH